MNQTKLNTTKRDRMHVRIACSQSHQYSKPREDTDLNVSRFGLAVKRQAGKQKGLGSIPLRLSFLFKMFARICGHCLVTLSLTVNETLKWLSSLPILMQESFRRWQCSDRYISLPPSSPVPNKPCGFCGRKTPWKKKTEVKTEEGFPVRY